MRTSCRKYVKGNFSQNSTHTSSYFANAYCMVFHGIQLFSFNFVGTDNIQRYSGVNRLVKQSLVAWALSCCFFTYKSVHGTINNEL